MLYVGYQRTENLPYLMFPGVAHATSYDGPFARVSEVPFLERMDGEATIRTAPFVIRVPSGFRMWYVSAKSWITTPVGTSVPFYSIRTIFSESGADWSAPSVEAIALNKEAGEVGLGRPWVVQHDGRLIMFYSVRYLRDDSTLVYLRIGCAVSSDGLTWERRDETLDFNCSSTGWDSEMVCYPAVLPVGDDWYMFYNGNRNGEGGLGCAKIFLEAL